MIKNPNNRLLYMVLFLLFCYLSFDFIVDAKQDFFVLNYNWGQSKNQPIGNVNVVDYKVNKLTIENPLNYHFNNQKTYIVNNQYFFRAAQITISGNELNFKGVHWINEYPRFLKGIITLSESELKLIQNTAPKIAMIGDSQMGWREGKYTRKWIAKKLNVQFIGNKMDVFGYPYFYDNDYNSQSLIENNSQFSNSEIIIIYLGLREKTEDFYSNLKQFVAFNKDKKIILIEHSIDKSRVDKVFEKGKPNAFYSIDLSEYNKATYYQKDGKHLNFEGHKKLAEDLILKLKSIGITKN